MGKFSLGQLVATSGVADKVHDDPVFGGVLR